MKTHFQGSNRSQISIVIKHSNVIGNIGVDIFVKKTNNNYINGTKFKTPIPKVTLKK